MLSLALGSTALLLTMLSLDLVPPGAGSRDPRVDRMSGRTSQHKQDAWVDRIFKGKRDGFVVESGAYNGLQYSNSLFFEVARGWDCLLVEANPALQGDILALHRRCTLLKGGLSTTRRPATFNFTMAGALGGIVESMSAKERAHAARAVQQQRGFARGAAGTGATVTVRCYPLQDVLLRGGLHRAGGGAVTTVDYWSLDTEGSEPDILNATDFDAIEVGLLTVEHNGRDLARRRIRHVLEAAGFSRARATLQDDYYAGKRYFAARGWAIPVAGA